MELRAAVKFVPFIADPPLWTLQCVGNQSVPSHYFCPDSRGVLIALDHICEKCGHPVSEGHITTNSNILGQFHQDMTHSCLLEIILCHTLIRATNHQHQLFQNVARVWNKIPGKSGCLLQKWCLANIDPTEWENEKMGTLSKKMTEKNEIPNRIKLSKPIVQ